ncbi:MAG: hypothetical protein M5T61_07825 [Acidimicrobiia bacterium]|nr:hypothetical protein [Acidimicrobiia bacterium]
MFFLDHAWLIPLIPAVSFLGILLFGKRAPRPASWVGVASVGASWALAVGALAQWIQRINDAEGAGTGHAVRTFGRSLVRIGAEGGGEAAHEALPRRAAGSPRCDVVDQRGLRPEGRRADRRPRRDDDVRRHHDLASGARVLDRVHAR